VGTWQNKEGLHCYGSIAEEEWRSCDDGSKTVLLVHGAILARDKVFVRRIVCGWMV